MPPTLAYGIGTGWLACHLLLRKMAIPALGTEDVGGSPRWRSAVGLFTSTVALPLLFVKAFVVESDMSHWCHRCEIEGLGPIDWGFVLIFAGLMGIDLLHNAMLTPTLKAHHTLCLVGHAYASLVTVEAFPHFFAGVVVLEIGSAASGIHALWPRRFFATTFVGIMSISNLAAALALLRWNLAMASGPHVYGRWLCPAVTCALLAMRQKCCIEVLRNQCIDKRCVKDMQKS